MVPLQLEVPLTTKGQGAHPVPQLLMLVSLTQRLPHRCWPAGQVKVQVVPSHDLAVDPAGLGQGLHEVPQVSGSVFEAQAAPHAWAPVGQARPHVLPSQVAFAAHGVQLAPHEATSEFDTQLEPQR